MVLHNDIWGDTSVIIIEEMDNQFLVVKELNTKMGTVPKLRS